MAYSLTIASLGIQNRRFAGTGGVSCENRSEGFVPAFLDSRSGAVYVSRTAEGCRAPIHLMDGLPERFVATRSESGAVLALKPGIVVGFLRDGSFYTREQTAQAMAEGAEGHVPRHPVTAVF
jgi:hypothetical protein